LCGWLLSFTPLPIPWLAGGLIAAGAFRLAGSEAAGVPLVVQRGAMVVIALNIAARFRWEALRVFAAHGAVVAAAVALVLGLAAFNARWVARLGGLDPVTAFFASIPGGASDMAVIGSDRGANPAVVAVLHAVRVTVVVLTVPALAAAEAGGADRASGIGGGAGPTAAGVAAVALLLAVVGTLGAGAGWVSGRLRVPSPYLLGPLVAFLAVQGAWGLPRPPAWALAAAQFAVGVRAGASLDRDTAVRIARALPVYGLSLVVLFAASAVSAWLLHAAAGTDAVTAILSAAPGGIAEMTLTATAIGADTSFVAALQILRVLCVILVLPFAWSALHRPGAAGTKSA
ncbi:MAG: AbrB family transcriptional regulator, partial [Clostridia bacterium]|nr:AbrB family transcriptional regulator [Clostridia bacterium]